MPVRIECNNCVISISEKGFRDLMWCMHAAEDAYDELYVDDADREALEALEESINDES